MALTDAKNTGARRYGGVAGLYASYRPGYPDAAALWLMEKAGLAAGDAVADVGSGTGLFTLCLLRQGLRVYAVEPNPEMRRMAEERLSGFGGFVSVGALAEDTGLPAGSVRLVTAAQAFHWFNPALFAAECRRLAGAGGMAALLWNRFDTQTPMMREYGALCRDAAKALPDGSAPAAPGRDGEMGEFFSAGPQYRAFENGFENDRESFVGGALSSSAAPQPGETGHDTFVWALNALFDKYAQNGRLAVPNLTECWLGQV